MDFKVTNPDPGDFLDIYRFVGDIEGLVQHPVHFFKIMTNYFGDSFFIIRNGENIAGMVWGFISQTDPDIFFLWQIGVAPEYRGKGLSRKLIEKLIEFAAAHGCKKVHATVETENIASWKMFEKMKFTNVSDGNTIMVDEKRALPNYYGSGTDQFLYEFKIEEKPA